jgi:DNA polymerase-1
MSRALVCIDTAMDLEFNSDLMKLGKVDSAKLKKMFEEFEFVSFLEGMQDGVANSLKIDRSEYKTILTEKSFNELMKSLAKKKYFAFDVETTSKRPVWARLVGISFSFEDGNAFYLPLAHRYLGVPEQLEFKVVREKLKQIFKDKSIKKCGHNIKYDLIVMSNEGIALDGVDFDTMIASYLLNPSSRRHGLDALTMEYFGHKNLTYKEMTGTGSKEIGFDEVEVDRATEYAAEDSDMTWRLKGKLQPQLKDSTLKLYKEIELPLLEVLAEIELNGVYVNRKHLTGLSSRIDKQLLHLEKDIHVLAAENLY